MSKSDDWIKRQDARTAARPGQADFDAKHWIVVNCSRHHDLPKQRRTAHYFRHPSEDAALTEANRLAIAMPGKRFSVYASGLSIKVEPESPASE